MSRTVTDSTLQVVRLYSNSVLSYVVQESVRVSVRVARLYV
jgi:hypothetical protein